MIFQGAANNYPIGNCGPSGKLPLIMIKNYQEVIRGALQTNPCWIAFITASLRQVT